MTLLVCRQSEYIIVRIVAVKTLVQLVVARIPTTWLYTTVASVLMHMVLVVAHNLLQSITILGNAARNLADRSVSKLIVRKDVIAEKVGKNPILVTALNPIIGYDLAAKIAKNAHENGLTLKESALQLGLLTSEQFDEWVRPEDMCGSLKK